MGVLESITTWTGANPGAPSPPASVLVIDDETGVRQALSAMLQADGYAVVTAGSGKEAVEQSRRQHFDLAITDLLMPEMDGIQTMAALKGVDPAMEVMVLTGHGGVDSAVEALRQGACDYLQKPLTMAQLCTAVSGALEKHQRNTPLAPSPAPASFTQKVMGLGRIRHREAWAYTLALALAVVMTASLLHFHIGRLYQEATAQWQARQSSVAEDRAQRVSDWLMERQADAEIFSNRPAVRAALQAYHVKGQLPGGAAGGRTELTADLDEMASVYYYNGVYLLDSDAHLVAESNYSEPLSPRLAEISRTVARTGTLRPEVLSDARGKTLVSFSAPVLSRRGATAGVRPTDQPRGVVVLVVDASQTLFRILTQEGAPTRTGETLLARREGDDVVLFSPLRHLPAGSPNLRFPLSTAPLATRAALEGRETFEEYNDYRGVPVQAATQYIPATGWGLVNKIDRAEAYENVRQMAVVEESAAGLLLILLGGLLAFHRRTVLMRALKQKEGEFRALLESAPDAMAITDREGRIVLVNAQAEILFGFGRKELIGQTLGMLFPEWARGRSGGGGPEDFAEVAARHVGVTFEMCGLRKGGKESPFEVRLSPVKEIEGGLFSCGIRDITKRKRAEEGLTRERDLLCALMESSPDYIYFKDCQSRFLRTNLAHAKALGLSESGQAVGKTDFDFFPEEDAKGYFSDERQIIQTGQPLIGRVEKVSQPDGQLLWCSTTKVPTRDAQGRITGLVGITRDVTERQRAEADLLRYAEDLETAKAAQEGHSAELAHLVEELARERDLLGTLMDNVPDAIYFKDSQSRFTRINASHARALGVADSRAALGKTDFDFFPQEDAQAFYAMEQKIVESGEPVIGALERLSDASGKFHWVSNTEVPVKDAQGRVTGIVGVARDVTEWKSTLEAFRESEERYRELFENASDLVYTTDLEGRITSLNRVAGQTLGYSLEEAVQMNLRQLLAPQQWQRIEQSCVHLLGGDSPSNLELEITTKDGRRVRLEVKPRLIYKAGKPVGVQGIGRDITGRDVAEMELRHAQKLESVGRLASGIAHEINTPIQFVGDNTRFLQDSFGSLQALLNKYQEFFSTAASGPLRPDFLAEVRRAEEESDSAYMLEEIPKAFTQTLEGIARVASIVRAMKDFAHPESKEMAAADLNKALVSTLTVARNELKYVSDVETNFGDMPLVVCNVGDLNQVFLNLLVNAAHAIGDVVKGTGTKGKIRVCTVPEGKTVLITISDTGGGIPEAIRTRIYDPFFTTKEVGRGTGQGLAIARSLVVERHKGSLTFESEVGKGTTFYIRLPLDPGEYSKETKAP